MKLASEAGTRALHVVSRDLARVADASDVASTLLEAISQWRDVEGALRLRFEQLDSGEVEGEPFLRFQAGPPLATAPQWLDGSVFETHLELMARALHPDQPYVSTGFPWVYQGASDDFLGPTADIAGFRLDEGVDFEGELAVVVDEVPMRQPVESALAHVKLIVLLNDVSLRAYAGREIRVGFGFINAKPSTAFAPVAVTPDELGDAWLDGRVHLPVDVHWNDDWFGSPNAGAMTYGFDEVISHVARTRRLTAGTIIGSGTVSNPDRSTGSACIAERRAIEIIDSGAPTTGFMQDGDRVRLEVRLPSGGNVFGTIEQRVVMEQEEP